jgi:hypothetical protein
MTENDRNTDPKDNARHAVESLTIFALSGFVIWLAVRFVMGEQGVSMLIGIAWYFGIVLVSYFACCAAAFLSVYRRGEAK